MIFKGIKCDICGATLHNYDKAMTKQLAEEKGWGIGEKDLCPACNPSNYKSTDLSVSLIYQRNLRNTLCDKMTELFSKYRKEDEIKMANIIGVSHRTFSDLLHKGHIPLNDFLLICDYLKPSEFLKEDWKHMYVEL